MQEPNLVIPLSAGGRVPYFLFPVTDTMIMAVAQIGTGRHAHPNNVFIQNDFKFLEISAILHNVVLSVGLFR